MTELHKDRRHNPLDPDTNTRWGRTVADTIYIIWRDILGLVSTAVVGYGVYLAGEKWGWWRVFGVFSALFVLGIVWRVVETGIELKRKELKFHGRSDEGAKGTASGGALKSPRAKALEWENAKKK